MDVGDERTRSWAFLILAAAAFLIGLLSGRSPAGAGRAEPPHPRALGP
jgi:hypothetical protein